MNKSSLRLAVSAVSMVLSGVASAAEAPAPAANAQSTSQIIGDWLLACAPQVKGRKSCVMLQTLVSEKLKKPVGMLTIGKDEAGKLKASFRMPVGVSLPAGVIVGVEKENSFAVPYTECHRTGCFAPFDLTEPMLGQLRKASKISAVAQSTSKQALNLTFSTRGFPDAYAAYLKETK